MILRIILLLFKLLRFYLVCLKLNYKILGIVINRIYVYLKF